ncbi:type III secretion protein [Betaproteobacteria bacterium]|nr:type III secretion protein [Betaproteobacteria bacterium]
MSMLEAVHTLMSSVETKATSMQEKIEKATQNKDELEQMDLLNIQFQLGQYNAMIEAASSIAKGTTEVLKSLAQRTS